MTEFHEVMISGSSKHRKTRAACCKRPILAIYVNERIANYGIKVCTAMSDSSGVKLLVVVGEANCRRDYGECEASWPDTALSHGVRETYSSGSEAAA